MCTLVKRLAPYQVVNVQYDPMLAMNSPIICDVVLDVLVSINMHSMGLFEVMQINNHTAEMNEMLCKTLSHFDCKGQKKVSLKKKIESHQMTKWFSEVQLIFLQCTKVEKVIPNEAPTINIG